MRPFSIAELVAHTALLVCAVASDASNGLPEPSRPVFPESFSVTTVELDDTLNSSVSVTQVLHRDSSARRSWMSAKGALVLGAEEQIMRCDIDPMGWAVVAGGPNASAPATWQCNNYSILSDPAHCQWSPFWTPLPSNATYAGVELMDGRAANRWDYWIGGERFALWASADAPVTPVASGKTWTWHQGYHLWRILWRDFVPGAPPLSVFEPTPGLRCPPATPPLDGGAEADARLAGVGGVPVLGHVSIRGAPLSASASSALRVLTTRVPLANAALPGTLMPVAGLGTDFSFCENATASGNASFAPSLQWLRLGGRRFDGALSYGCDAGVGAALHASGVPRADAFLVSKVGPGGLPEALGYNETIAQAQQILSQLGEEYIDLLLVHEPFTYWPDPAGAASTPSTDPACDLRGSGYSERGCRLSTWRAMVALWRAGAARAIGVSNYNSTHIEEIVAAGLPLPAVNQLQFSPHHGPQHTPCTCGHSTSRPTVRCTMAPAQTCAELFEYMAHRNITVNGYSPFEGKVGGASLLTEPRLVTIANSHNVTPSQVVLHWQWKRHGVLVNPTAASLEYQRLNLLFGDDDLRLSEDELDELDAWPQNPPP